MQDASGWEQVWWGPPAPLSLFFLLWLCEDSGRRCIVLAPGGGELRDPSPAFKVKMAFSCSRYSRGGRGGGGGGGEYCGVPSDTVSYVFPLCYHLFFLGFFFCGLLIPFVPVRP